MHRVHLLLRLMKIPLDFAGAFGGTLLAYWMRKTSDFIPGVQLDIVYIPPFQEYLKFAALSAGLFVILAALGGLYSLKRNTPLRIETFKLISVAFIWLMTVIAYFFLTREYFFSRLVLLYGSIWLVIFAMLGRLIIRAVARALLDRGVGRISVLFLGQNDITKTLQAHMSTSRTYRIAGVIAAPITSLDTLEIDGETRTFEQLLGFRKVEEVIMTKQPKDPLIMSSIVNVCRQRHVRFRFAPDVMELQFTNIEVVWEREVPLIELRPTALDGWGRVLKRIIDILGALVGIIILSPIWVVAAIVIWLERSSPLEIIYATNRYGHQGKLFRFYKFQSMRKNAEQEMGKLLAEGKSERKGFLKMKDDPRVTKLGRFLRKTSIDEIPQLLNVLKGDMSLVGPRPHMPLEIDQLTRDYHRVLCVKPGLTSLAQINGRSNLDFEDEMRLDLTYIEQWSLLLDVVIILRTIEMVLFKRDNVS